MMSSPGPSSRTILILVLAVSLVYVFRTIDRGWVPHDEGTMAETAVRVLQGELPHRDFDDMYTGGLTFLHAAAFEVVGTSLLVLRLTLFAAFGFWVLTVYFIARRLKGPLWAAGTTLLAVAWSVPNYPAPMPSWYNLFLATWGVAALVRYSDTGRLRWLVVAGAVGGLSALVKIVGLYFVAGGLLYLVYRAQATRPPPAVGARKRPSVLTLFVTASLSLFALVVLTLVAQRMTPEAVFHFVLPPLSVAAFLVWREWKRAAIDPPGELRRLLGTTSTFIAGAALPVIAFIGLYAVGGGLDALYQGVIVLPRERFFFAWRNPDSLRTVVAALPVVGLAVAAAILEGKAARVLAAVAAVVGGCLLFTGDSLPVYRGVWLGMRPLLVIAVVAGLVLLGRRSRDEDDDRDAITFLLIAVTAVHGLIQFPMSAPVYFFYAAPLLALTALGIFATTRAAPPVPLVLAAFYILFTAQWFHTGYIYQMGDYYAAHPPTEPLQLERGGIRVVPQEKTEVETMAAYVAQFATGDYILALPDAPEVYFLTAKRNPTRTLFDFFDDREGRVDRIIEALDHHQVNLVVLNDGPAVFSEPPPPALLEVLMERYPLAVRTGRFLILRRH